MITLVRKQRNGSWQTMQVKESQLRKPSWKQKKSNQLTFSKGWRELEEGEEIVIKGAKNDIKLKGKKKAEEIPVQ